MESVKKFFKWAGIVLLALIVISLVYSILGMDDVLKVQIEDVDMADIADGIYVGSYDNYRWSNMVEVTVTGHQITSIEPLKIQNGGEDIVRDLTARILERQMPNVDAVSGATASSNGFLKAVETALKSAAK